MGEKRFGAAAVMEVWGQVRICMGGVRGWLIMEGKEKLYPLVGGLVDVWYGVGEGEVWEKEDEEDGGEVVYGRGRGV